MRSILQLLKRSIPTLPVWVLAAAPLTGQVPEGYRETTIEGLTRFGLDPAWRAGREFETAFDGDVATFYDYRYGDVESFVGIDFGQARKPLVIEFAPRAARADRMVGGRFEGSNESTVSGFVTLYTVTRKPSNGLQKVELSADESYRYYRYVAPVGSYGNIAEFKVLAEAPAVEETAPRPSAPEGFRTATLNGRVVFGLDPAWTTGREFEKVFDGDPATFYDFRYRDRETFVGFDHGLAERPVRIDFAPRTGAYASRMIGGLFQGSNESAYSGYVTLHTVEEAPSAEGESVALQVAESYRYYRYLAPAGSHGNIGEFSVTMASAAAVDEPEEPTPSEPVEEAPTPATPEGHRETLAAKGLLFGLDPSWREDRCFEAVFDGDPDTYFDFRHSDRKTYAGIDKGQAFVPHSIRYTPRKGWSIRMLGGRFQGSNESTTSGFETIHLVRTFTSDEEQVVPLSTDKSYRYYRYLAPAGSYGNIAGFDVLSAEEAAAPAEGDDTVPPEEEAEEEPPLAEDGGGGSDPAADPVQEEEPASSVAVEVAAVRNLDARGVAIDFSIPEEGIVSGAVYNAYGQMIRTLLMGERLEAGAHTVVWDGLDRDGRRAEAGEYSFKLLRSEGFTARYVANLGINPGSASYDTWVGNHDGAASVAVDSTGVYIAAQITETAPVLLKQSFDGSQRHWEKTRYDVTDGRFQGGISLASDGRGRLYMLQQNGRLQVIESASGKKLASWDVLPPDVDRSDHRYELVYQHLNQEVAGADLAAAGDYLVLSFRDSNKLRWLNPANGSLIREMTVNAPAGVAVNTNGEVYVASGKKILRVVNGVARDFVGSGLSAPQRLSFDASTNTLLVVDGIEGGNIKRFDLNGALVDSYGKPDGRDDGRYLAENFHAVRDVVADGQGGFLVAEPVSPPRRVAHINAAGAVLNEWFGGQNYYAWAEPDPRDPGRVWINADEGLVLVDLDLESGEWSVLESYDINTLADGLIKSYGGHQGMWQVVYDGDYRYLVSEFIPQVLYHEDGALVPVSITSTDYDQIGRARSLAGYAGTANSFRWLDENGDGRPQASEFVFSNSRVIPNVDHVHDDFNLFGLDRPNSTFDLVKSSVRWGAYGPYYPFGSDRGMNDVQASTPVVERTESRGAGVFVSSEGELYGHYNIRRECQGLGWPTFWASISRFVKWDAQGNELWSVGRHAYHGGLATYLTDKLDTPSGQMHVPLKVIGEIEDTVVLADRVESPGAIWTKDGLYAGTVFDHRTEDGLPAVVYAWHQTESGAEAITTSDNASGGSIVRAPDGRVYLYTQGRNSVPVYEISGWNLLESAERSFAFAAGQAQAAGNGTGLLANYYEGYFSGSAKIRRTESRIWHGVDKVDDVIDGHRSPVYDWSQGPEGLGRTSDFSVRWVGELEAPLTEDYTFSFYSRGGVRVWVDGEQVLACRSNRIERVESEPVRLVAGQRYRIQVEFDTNEPQPAASLNWESRNIDRERIPTRYLYPVDSGLTDRQLRPAGETIAASSFDRDFGGLDGWLLDQTAVTGKRQWSFSKNGAWLAYDNVDFSEAPRTLTILADSAKVRSTDSYPIRLSFRLDSPTGPEIADFVLSETLETHRATIPALSGERSVYVVNETGDHWHEVDLREFRFE